mmetsp:Transcript_27233/g.69966  ORF Transcript_27233/g.69966 Transcript_27233/m.69966 type:complete len:209 (+) Transcript_27233:358-984(+)
MVAVARGGSGCVVAHVVSAARGGVITRCARLLVRPGLLGIAACWRARRSGGHRAACLRIIIARLSILVRTRGTLSAHHWLVRVRSPLGRGGLLETGLPRARRLALGIHLALSWIVGGGGVLGGRLAQHQLALRVHHTVQILDLLSKGVLLPHDEAAHRVVVCLSQDGLGESRVHVGVQALVLAVFGRALSSAQCSVVRRVPAVRAGVR